MKKTVGLVILTLLFAFLGTLLWSLWATYGACDGLEWFLEALIMTVALRAPVWVWCLSALAFWGVRFAVIRLKAQKQESF